MCIHNALSKIISKDDLDIFIKFTTTHKDHNFQNCHNCDEETDSSQLNIFCLFSAVDVRAINILRYLLELDPNNIQQTKYGETLLHCAVYKNREDIVELLLKYHADVHKEAGYKRTPLHYAAIESRNEKIVTLLLNHGADPNKKDEYGHTPLYQSSQHRMLPILKVLLEKGADPNIKTNTGDTPIHIATRYCEIDNLELLLMYKADVNIESSDGETPLHVAPL